MDDLVEQAASVFASDERIAAGWLEGSHAAGTADAWSDVDLYVAVRDGDYDAVVDERLALIERVGHVIGSGENPIPGGFLVYANLEGLRRLDVIFTREGEIEQQHPVGYKVLFDKTGATQKLRPREGVPDVSAQVQRVVREFFYGCFMSRRLIGRREWATLQMAIYMQLFYHVIPAWLAVDDPANAFRPTLHLERFLKPGRKEGLDSILEAIHRTFAGGEPDDEAVRALTEKQMAVVLPALRAACERWQVAYPAADEASVLETYRRDLGLAVGRKRE